MCTAGEMLNESPIDLFKLIYKRSYPIVIWFVNVKLFIGSSFYSIFLLNKRVLFLRKMWKTFLFYDTTSHQEKNWHLFYLKKKKKMTAVLSVCAHSTLPSIHVPARPRHDLPACVSHLSCSLPLFHTHAQTHTYTPSTASEFIAIVHYYLLQYSHLLGKYNLTIFREIKYLSFYMLTHCCVY